MIETEWVYLIGCAQNSLVKIGRSVDVQRRFGDIQRMSPVKLELLWKTEGGWKLESNLHLVFRRRRVHGEWFDFSGCDPVQMAQNAVAGEPTEPQGTDWTYEPSEEVGILRSSMKVRPSMRVRSRREELIHEFATPVPWRKSGYSLDICVEVAVVLIDRG